MLGECDPVYIIKHLALDLNFYVLSICQKWTNQHNDFLDSNRKKTHYQGTNCY